MKNDKFLLGIIIGIVGLVIVAVVLVLTRSRTEEYVADDTPAGVVHNYYLAIQRKEYEKAYSYLSDELKSKPDLDEFIIAVENYGYRRESALTIGETTITNDRARVNIVITTYSGGLFDSGSYSRQAVVHLRAAADGRWKITRFPYPFWGYNWDESSD